MDNDFYDKLENYFEKFGDVFPMMEYDLPKSKVKTLIDECLKLNKPIEEVLPLNQLDENIIY